MFLMTKIGPDTFDDTYAAVKKHLEEFQATTKGVHTKIDYFDAVLLHWPNLYDDKALQHGEASLPLL